MFDGFYFLHVNLELLSSEEMRIIITDSSGAETCRKTWSRKELNDSKPRYLTCAKTFVVEDSSYQYVVGEDHQKAQKSYQ